MKFHINHPNSLSEAYNVPNLIRKNECDFFSIHSLQKLPNTTGVGPLQIIQQPNATNNFTAGFTANDLTPSNGGSCVPADLCHDSSFYSFQVVMITKCPFTNHPSKSPSFIPTGLIFS